MRPLFDAEEMRAVDRWAIEEQGIPEAELMEAAGTALAEAVARLAPQGPVRILCGKGNNGGDGLVAARRLEAMGFEVEALEVFGDELPADLDAWLAGSGAVVDAIFGTGFEGAPREPAIAADRGGQPLRGADRRLRHRLRRRRLDRRGRGRRDRGLDHRRLPRRQDRAPGRARARPTPASSSSRRSGFPTGRRSSRGRRRSTPRCSAWRRAAAPPRPSSAPARSRSPAARAG